MKEERMSILKMVEDGKISADDAVKLFEAIQKPGKKNFDSAEWQAGLEEKVRAFAKNMDEMGKDLGKKLEELGKDVEPKIKKVTQAIIEKTTECVDEVTKALKKEEAECCCEEEEKTDGCCCAGGEQDKSEGCCGEEPREN